jgi:hypothetical protein
MELRIIQRVQRKYARCLEDMKTMILLISGSNRIIEVTASDIKVTIKKRKTTSLFSDALLGQKSKMEIWEI